MHWGSLRLLAIVVRVHGTLDAILARGRLPPPTKRPRWFLLANVYKSGRIKVGHFVRRSWQLDASYFPVNLYVVRGRIY